MSKIKSVIVGDSQVGKTSLLISYTAKGFCSWHNSNVFDNFLVKVALGSSFVDLEVWDTSGEDSEFSARQIIHHGVSVYLLCFELDNIASYHNVRTKWYPEIRRCDPEVPIVLVGTQSDLREADDTRHLFVTTQMGEQLKEEINACAYIECSALEDTGLDTVFEEAIRYARSSSHQPRSDENSTGEVLRSWLESHVDTYLYEQAVECGADKMDLSSRIRAATYLDRLRSGLAEDYSPPVWAVAGTEIDRKLFCTALANGAKSSDLFGRDKAHQFVNVLRAAGLTVDVPPSWVIDSNTMNTFSKALERSIPPPMLNIRADTEMFLLNIEDVNRQVSCWPWGLFGWDSRHSIAGVASK